MSSLKTFYRGQRARVAVIDLITAIVYAVVVLAVLTALGLWWLFPIVLAVLIVGYGLRAVLRARRGRRSPAPAAGDPENER